jgi:hypothetical protein
MRKLLSFGALATLVCFMATIAQAQFGRGFGGVTGYQLLLNKSVQEELKLSDEQKEKFKELGTKFTEQAKANREKVSDIEDFKEKFEKLGAMNKELNETAMKDLLPILKEEQVKRFKQIERQQMRTALFANEEFVKAIKLTDEQKEKIKGLTDDMSNDLKELGKALFSKELTQEEFGTKMKSLTKEMDEKIAAILNEDQKKVHKEMLGEPFEVKQEKGAFKGFNKKKKD